jgi:hypothetical protein
MKTSSLILASALLAELAATPAHAQWTISADPAAMRPLPSQWQQYFGIHYGTAAGYDGPWFQTVRSYGAPNMGLPRNADGTLNTAALTGTPVTGPFLGETYAVGPQDIRNYDFNSPGLDTLVPDLLANGLTTIYPTPNLFFPPQPVNQDLAYVTLRSVYGAFPDAATKVLWQWGNEVNGKNWDPSLTDTPPNQASQVPFYAEAYFARGIEALYRVSQDLYGDSRRIPVMSGSFANIYNVNYRNWMRSVLNYQVTGTYAPTLTGSAIWQHVDVLTVHYPFSAGEGGGAVMQEMWDEWIASGKIPSLWVTEDHGEQGGGPSTLLARSMRYLGWIATNGANASQTRLSWWGTNDNDDAGGQAIEAVNLLGQLLAGTAIRQSSITLDGAEIYLVGNGDAESLTRLTLAILPPGAEETGGSAITPVDPGTITLALPPGGVGDVGPATAVQYSRDVPSQTWTPTVSVSGTEVRITVGRVISSPVLITIPWGPPPGAAFCPGDGSGAACPCGNDAPSGAGTGCTSSLGNGALLAASGTASVGSDSFVLSGSQMPDSSALYFQGTTRVDASLGSVFGDGLRCAGGAVIRLGTKTNASGASQYPAPGDASVSVRGAVAAGDVRTYQVWYRNAATFCTADTFNLSNGYEAAWAP